MTWEVFYLVCFGVGLGLSVLSFAGGLGHHIHLGTHSAGHGHASGHRGNGSSPINAFTLTTFLCWFGGAGYLLNRYGGFVVPIVLLLAIVSGLAGGSLIFWFLARVLLPHEKALTAEETEMTGVIGRVSGSIGERGTGEIIFSQNGARHSSPARSENGSPIPREVEVVVMRYERGIAYVRPWEDFSGGEPLQTGEPRTGRANR